MKPKLTNGMLFIGVVLLGAFIWFIEREGETSHEKLQRTRTVFAVYPGSINSILLERDGVEIECSKASGAWRMVRPADASVDPGMVEKMIAGMARVERGELITADTLRDRGLSASDYGFDEPRARITFQNNRGTFTWLVGRDAPLGDMLYVMTENTKDIIAAPQTLIHLIPKDPAWIRDHTLFSDEVAAVRGIDLRRPGGFLQLRQTEQDGWVMQQPYKGRANILSVHALIEKIRTALISEFITDEKSDLTVYGLEEPTYELTLFTQDELTQTLRIGKGNPDNPETHYAKWADSESVFTVPAEWVQGLEVENAQFRSRHILGALPGRLTHLQIERGEQLIDLVKTNGSWQIMRPARWEAEADQVKALLDTLSLAVVQEFVDAPSNEQSQHIADAPWTVTFTENEAVHTLRISAVTPDGLRLVQRDDEPSLYTTASTIVSEEFAAPLFYRSRTVLQIDPAKIEKITQHAVEEQFQVQKMENSFAPMDRTQQLDSDAVFGLTSELMALRTIGYVAFNPDSLAPYGLSEPSFRLNVTLSGPDTLGRVLRLGDTVNGGRFAMLQGQAIVFILSDKTVRTLTRNVTTPLENDSEETEMP